MIKETSDYEIFSKVVHNRPYDEANIKRIMKSLQINNLLPYRPILVDSKMGIIDGQHRLEAARRLRIPVHYEVKSEISHKDIILLNENCKNWCRDDYLNYYCTEKVPDYLKLKNFMNDHKLTLSITLAILGLNKESSKGDGKSSSFKNGEFVFPSAIEEINSVKILHESQQVIDYMSPKLPVKQAYIHGSSFRRALYIFLSIGAVDFDVFMDKIAYRLDLMRPCARINDYVTIFKVMYNWKNKNPITVEENEIN